MNRDIVGCDQVASNHGSNLLYRMQPNRCVNCGRLGTLGFDDVFPTQVGAIRLITAATDLAAVS